MNYHSDRDVVSLAYPKGFLQLFSLSEVESTSEALCILLHTCMLDVGFLPGNVEECNIFKCMPEGWKAKGVWKFKYYHKTCPEVYCWKTIVPLYSVLAVYGVIDDGLTHDTLNFKLKTTLYLNAEANLSNAESLFVKSEKLVRKFKDGFCFPLLAQLQESTGCEPSFGLCITVDEVKLYILKLLPVQSVVSLSRVNKDFHLIANSSPVWQHLVERDFGLIDSPSAWSLNYKELYKREYLKKQQRARRQSPVYDPYYNPSIIPPITSRYVDVGRDIDPAIQRAFPHLRDRFRPNYIFPPYDYLGHFM